MKALRGNLIAIFLFFVTLCCQTLASASKTSQNDPKEILQNLVSKARNQYDKLPDQGKFATGAVVGYTTSKVVVNSAVKFVKIAGAAFVATEVLEAAGILEMDTLTQSESSESIKTNAINKIGEFRSTIRKRLDGKNLKRWLETDRMGTLGAATGAFFGFLL
mmetsp:Transcript_16201/g.37538  ORF Transcript_16201/g.37538 Transcript_16201/m.37538 type:complete len:162 (+) Transcript_16201:50-535(+)